MAYSDLWELKNIIEFINFNMIYVINYLESILIMKSFNYLIFFVIYLYFISLM